MLTARQEKFCLEYAKNGNATAAYLNAGYSSNEAAAAVKACRLLKIPKIIERLQALSSEIKRDKIASVIECQEILTRIARDENAERADRIKAIQLLMKAQGAFVTQVQFKTTPVVISGGERLED